MAKIPETTNALELLNFMGWIPGGGDYEERLRRLVEQGKLPPDVLFRAMSIGAYELTPESTDENRVSLYWATVTDAMNNADTPSTAQVQAQQLIFCDALPNTVIDLREYTTKKLYSHLSSIYWSRNALKKVILQRRAAEGAALTDPRNEFYWTWDAELREKNRCQGLAQGVWRTLVRRLRPDILEHPRWFYPGRHMSMFGTYELSERTIRRNAIACTRIEDETMKSLYDEIDTIGMKGIGPVGKRDLAAMLAPEHPDVMQRLAEEEGLSFESIDE